MNVVWNGDVKADRDGARLPACLHQSWDILCPVVAVLNNDWIVSLLIKMENTNNTGQKNKHCSIILVMEMWK